MSQFYLNTISAEDWKNGLASPDKQWKKGFSARTLAYSWETANGFPDIVKKEFKICDFSFFNNLNFLLGIPEYKVSLPGGNRDSQNDIFVLAKNNNNQLISIMVEGKCDETFGPLFGEWYKNPSQGKKKRISHIKSILNIKNKISKDIRYQLLHRSASAIIEAKKFNCKYAILLIHSFNQDDLWIEDYYKFISLFGLIEKKKGVQLLNKIDGIEFYGMWVTGEKTFLEK